MLILRTVGLLLLVAIAVCIAAWILTAQPRYLAWTRSLVKVGLAALLVFFALMVLERLIVI